MNSVIIFPHEVSHQIIELSGDRAQEIIKKIGKRNIFPVGIYEEARAIAEVINKSESNLTLKIFDRRTELPRVPINLIVGLSRPQTVKKVIQASGLFGIEKLTFLASENGEKSYLSSHSLLSNEIQNELILSIEQSCDTRIPIVSVITSFKDLDTDFGSSQRFLFDVHGKPLKELNLISDTRCTVSVGPEAGWSEKEKDFFLSHGFVSHTFGERVLRVETAVVGFFGAFTKS